MVLISVKFSRIPVRTEALFAMPLGTNDQTSAELDQRYRVQAMSEKSVSLQRMVLEPERVLQRHVAEITETSYPSYEKAVQGLLRGEISMLPSVPVWQLDQLEKNGNFFVRKYAVPQTHFVQFNPQSKPLRSAELRRALLYSLDRSQVRLGNDSDAEALCFQQTAHQRHTEARMVDVGVTGDEDHITGIPA